MPKDNILNMDSMLADTVVKDENGSENHVNVKPDENLAAGIEAKPEKAPIIEDEPSSETDKELEKELLLAQENIEKFNSLVKDKSKLRAFLEKHPEAIEKIKDVGRVILAFIIIAGLAFVSYKLFKHGVDLSKFDPGAFHSKLAGELPGEHALSYATGTITGLIALMGFCEGVKAVVND